MAITHLQAKRCVTCATFYARLNSIHIIGCSDVFQKNICTTRLSYAPSTNILLSQTSSHLCTIVKSADQIKLCRLFTFFVNQCFNPIVAYYFLLKCCSSMLRYQLGSQLMTPASIYFDQTFVLDAHHNLHEYQNGVLFSRFASEIDAFNSDFNVLIQSLIIHEVLLLLRLSLCFTLNP